MYFADHTDASYLPTGNSDMNNMISMIRESSAGVLFESGRYLIVCHNAQSDSRLWSFPCSLQRYKGPVQRHLKTGIEKELGIVVEVRDLLKEYRVSCNGEEFKRRVYWISRKGTGLIRAREGFAFKWVTLEELAGMSMVMIDQPLVSILEDLSFA